MLRRGKTSSATIPSAELDVGLAGSGAIPPSRTGVRRRVLGIRIRGEVVAAAISIVLLCYFAIVPLVFLLVNSVRDGSGAWTFDNFSRYLTDPYLLQLMKNTTLFSLGSTAFSLSLGIFFAWVIERTNTPFKKAFFALSLVPLIIPNLLFVISWIFLASPQIGILNRWLVSLFGLQSPPFNIFSIPGMIWVDGLHASPIAFLLMIAAFRSMDPSLEEAAQMSGATVRQTTRFITLKLAWPGIVAALLITFIRAFESFETPALLGLPVRTNVFTSEIYTALRIYPRQMGRASVYGVLLIALASVLLYLHNRSTRESEKYQTVTGKGFRPRTMDLGRARYLPMVVGLLYFLVLVVVPMTVLVWVSFQGYFRQPSVEALGAMTLDNYRFVFDYPLIARAAKNSLILGVASATIVVLVTAVVSWVVVKTKARGRGFLDAVTFLPIVFPGVVLGTAILLTYLRFQIGVYGTILIILIAYITKYMPYGVRYNKVAMIQIHAELEESAKMSGASWGQVFRRVTLPLLKSGMVAGWIYIFILATRELSSSILLYSPGDEVLAITIWEFWDNGQVGALAAVGVMMIIALVVVVLVMQVITRRFGTEGV